MDNVTDGKDSVTINGQSKHIIGYLQDFLFTPERSRTLVKSLSGGEKNRLLLARLFAQPANLLVLDEPTNDLDVETLEMLENVLADYEGTLLVVSHDRAFLDNVVTSTLVFEGKGRVDEFLGGYREWMAQRAADQASRSRMEKLAVSPREPVNKAASSRGKKLSYREQKELEGLPELIESLEAEQSALQDLMASADFYRRDKQEITVSLERAESLKQELDAAYGRWEALDSISS
jgi:ATP-binding cassette subfamily F protein uup